MKDGKKSGPLTRMLNRMESRNSEIHSAKADNTSRLDYRAGNVIQNQPKADNLWMSCPVLDETGQPVKEE
jgi:hypothetical protein